MTIPPGEPGQSPQLSPKTIQSGNPKSPEVRAAIVLTEALHIPAYQDCLFFGQTKPSLPDGEIGLVSGCPWKLNKFGIGVANVLCSVNNHKVPLRYLNPSNRTFWIPAGTAVARLSPIQAMSGCVIPLTKDWCRLCAMSADNVAKVPEEIQEAIRRLPEHLTLPQRHTAVELLLEFTDIAARKDTPMGRTDWVKHRIDTGDA